MTQDYGSAAPAEDTTQAEPDLTRFNAEPPKPKRTRLYVSLAFIFMAILAALWVGGHAMSAKLGKIIDERRERQAESKAENKDSVAARKNLDLGKPSNLPVEAAATAPAEQIVPAAEPIPLAGNGKPQSHSPSGYQQTQAGIDTKPSRPSMMLGSDSDTTEAQTIQAVTQAINSANGGQTAQTSTTKKQRSASVQDEAGDSLTSALTKTPQVRAAKLGNRDFLLARGGDIPCVLQKQILSNIPGTTSCLITENIYSDNGAVLLMEKGSKVEGSYSQGLKVGDVRLAVMWERVKTTNGVVIDLDSPSTDSVGAAGVPGWVDNKWMERIGAAFLLSIIQDAVTLEASKSGAGNNGNGYPAYGNSQSNVTKMSEKVLDSTIGIAPTIIKNRGELINISVNRDVWFDQVYAVNQK